MSAFHYQNKHLFVENVSIAAIAAQFGTPCYIYSRTTIEENWQTFAKEFDCYPHRICYAVKANSNLAILKLLARLNSGFDIVSGGELARVLTAGGDPKKIIFSGVGKQAWEIEHALDAGIYCFNIESESELERIQAIALQKNKIADIALRLNPNIDALTHRYIATGLKENKFGIDIKNAFGLCNKIKTMSHLNLIGIGCHIGSQLTDLAPLLAAIDLLLELIEELKAAKIYLKHIDVGGGLGICYKDENPPSISDYVRAVLKKLSHTHLEIILEPGRIIVAEAGILVTRVEYLKTTDHTHFAIVDAGMNDYVRPVLYDAWQKIIPVKQQDEIAVKTYDIVGPVCESADFLGKNRPLAIQENDLLALCATGAYGSSMSSQYNSRPRAAEILVHNGTTRLIRPRETVTDLFSSEIECLNEG